MTLKIGVWEDFSEGVTTRWDLVLCADKDCEHHIYVHAIKVSRDHYFQVTRNDPSGETFIAFIEVGKRTGVRYSYNGSARGVEDVLALINGKDEELPPFVQAMLDQIPP